MNRAMKYTMAMKLAEQTTTMELKLKAAARRPGNNCAKFRRRRRGCRLRRTLKTLDASGGLTPEGE